MKEWHSISVMVFIILFTIIIALWHFNIKRLDVHQCTTLLEPIDKPQSKRSFW